LTIAEPGQPLLWPKDRDLAAVIGRNIRARLGGQHGEGLAASGIIADQAGNADEAAAGHLEQPAILPLLLRVGGSRELVETVGDDQAPPAWKLAAVGAEVVNRLAALTGPAPAADDEVESLVGRCPDDRTGIGDSDVTRLQVGDSFGEAKDDLLLAEQARNLVRRFRLGVEVAHPRCADAKKIGP